MKNKIALLSLCLALCLTTACSMRKCPCAGSGDKPAACGEKKCSADKCSGSGSCAEKKCGAEGKSSCSGK